MMDTILFDLDGTLLSMSQETFVSTYFKLLTAKLAPAGYEPKALIDALWQGTAAMVKNDGTRPNCDRFWDSFRQHFQLSEQKVDEARALCDGFYSQEFNQTAKALSPVGDAPARAVRTLAAKGYRLVLATNPIFPPPAVVSRLGWIGLTVDDFVLTTDYENSSFCKPNLDYYRHICRRLEIEPQQCLMVGNSVKEDMCAAQLGMATYLVTGFVEGDDGDLGRFRLSGSIEDFARYAEGMPSVSVQA